MSTDSQAASINSSTEKKTITIAVAGNPNSGKSTLINAIAGTRLQVGNWPGVTVEKKEADFEYKGKTIKVVDLPGTYSLSPYTQEEIVARDYLVYEKPDLIVNVVDATNLERNLYLTVQLLELEIPVVIALNIYDEAEKKGYKINTSVMEEVLGISIVPTIATKGEGLNKLFDKVVEVGEDPGSHKPKRLHYEEDVNAAQESVGEELKKHHPSLTERFPLRWLASKVIEGDSHLFEDIDIDNDKCLSGHPVKHLIDSYGDDLESAMADARYAIASGLTHEVLKRPTIKKAELTEKIDSIVLNRFFGIPIFLASIWLVFKMTFDVANPLVDWVDAMTTGPFIRWTAAIMGFIKAPEWLISLATEGIIAGVGFVLTFVPVIFAMMFFITFLEGSGYMARAAFVMDRAMHTIGLHGKSFIPMLLGFGCNVPAVYATRTLENPRDKALTALLVPLMSCGARLPVYVLFVGAFFPRHPGTVLWSLYVLGIAMAVLMGMILKKTLFKGETPMFIMELPPYRMPSFKSLMIHTWEKGKHFIVKAGTYIFAVSILVWFLLNLPWGVVDKKDSYLGKTGQAVAPILEPLGFEGWEASASLVTGVIAKEIVVGTMGEIYISRIEEKEGEIPTLGEDLREIGTSFIGALHDGFENVISTFGVATLAAEEEEEVAPLRAAVKKAFTPLSAYAFMAFVLLYMPCVVVLIAMRHEFGTWKWSAVTFCYQMVLAWTVAFLIYQGGKVLGFE